MSLVISKVIRILLRFVLVKSVGSKHLSTREHIKLCIYNILRKVQEEKLTIFYRALDNYTLVDVTLFIYMQILKIVEELYILTC